MNAKFLQRRGGKMILCNPQPKVARLLTASGVDTVIPVCTSRELAIAQFVEFSPAGPPGASRP